jgi:hypothetical protein
MFSCVPKFWACTTNQTSENFIQHLLLDKAHHRDMSVFNQHADNFNPSKVWFGSYLCSNSPIPVIKVVLQSQNYGIIHKSHKSCSQFGGALFGTVFFLVGNWHSDNISTGQNIYSDVIDPRTGILSRVNIQEANSGWTLQTEQFGWRPRDLQS